jgi:hypothetical protein
MDLLRRRMSKMSDDDYDDEAYQKATNMTHKDNANGHGSDAYKLPNHPTFSQDSLASNPLQPGGVWDERGFTPSEHNLRNMPPEHLQDYFNNVEHEVDETGRPKYTKYNTEYGQAEVPVVVPLNLPNNMRLSRFRELKDKLKK